MIPSPPPSNPSDLPAGTRLTAGLSHATVLPDIDFETYSEAGCVWDREGWRWVPPEGAKKKGLPVVGMYVYAQHPSADILSCAYNLKDGNGAHLWIPGMSPPTDLFDHVLAGGLLEAWNAHFEYVIWRYVGQKRYGWPELKLTQLRCAAAKARAFALPGALQNAGEVLNTKIQKDKDGKRLLDKFSMPRNPTRMNMDTRILPSSDPDDAQRLYQYNLQDIEAEAEISSLVPDLNDFELLFWQCDQAINARGIRIDADAVTACREILRQAHEIYNLELQSITGGQVTRSSQLRKMMHWMASRKNYVTSLSSENVKLLLKNKMLPPDVRRVIEIRSMLGSAAVKKLIAMTNIKCDDDRLRNLFIYHSARTGRAAGADVQPQNMPNSGDAAWQCNSCKKHYGHTLTVCPWCASASRANVEWNTACVNDALDSLKSRSVRVVENMWGNPISTISGCLRGLFIPADGCDFICSDYSAIEAVVLAVLAGEEWQIEVFRTHGKIYEMTASKICGMPFEEFGLYKSTSGHHHPKRKLGKLASLASGYGGWIGAWKAFNADEFLSDDEIKESILNWREANPNIVEMWGGQSSWKRHDYFGLEGMAIESVRNPGIEFNFRGIKFITVRDTLYCKLLSGRYLTYHRPQLSESERRPGTLELSFEGYNSNPKNGAIGWVRLYTYGGKLTENVVQATARDILAHAIITLEKHNYPVVLHVHDEIVCEVPENFGSVDELEKLMSIMPEWAEGWPVRATGGWRGKRYTK